MNIDLSKMTHAVRSKNKPDFVIGVFPDEGNAAQHKSRQCNSDRWEIVPITPPAPKYPKADVPTHCVVGVSNDGVCYLGTEPECLTNADGDHRRIRTCDHWFAKEEP